MSTKKQKPIVLFLKEQKIQGMVRHDAFFAEANVKQNRYIGEKGEHLDVHLNKFKQLGSFERTVLWRDILFLAAANMNGHVFVDWDRFFALPFKNLLTTTKETSKIISERFKYIPEAWDRELVEQEKKRVQKQQNNIR